MLTNSVAKLCLSSSVSPSALDLSSFDLRLYGVGEGEADSEGDASVSAAFFLVAVVVFFFRVGDGDGVALVVAGAINGSCVFSVQEATNAIATSMVIKDKTDFFIGCS